MENDKYTYLNPEHFRPETKHKVYNIHFFLSGGGLGDYINHMPAFEWIAENCPHVRGTIYIDYPFNDVAKHIMKKYSKWRVYLKSQFESVVKEGELIINPDDFKKYISATGAHLLDLGFMYYCNRYKPYERYNRLPRINYEGPSVFVPPVKPYAVLTPGFTAKARAMPGQYVNEISRYLISKDIIPVYLGKADFTNMGDKRGYFAKFPEDVDYSLGLDYREKTILLDAIGIMSKAKMVIGIDNGLLHMAGTTEVPIIFGHTVATVEDRIIRRPKGMTLNIEISKETLACIGCQSKMRFIPGHRFSFCIYDDYKCLDLLMYNNAKHWKDAIDYVIAKT